MYDAAMRQAFTQLAPGVFCWADTCNVYVIKDGSAAILIDLGDGSVLDALPQIGVSEIEWVLFTHHHREQCQGFPKLAGHPACRGVKIAAPAAERDLFEMPLEFRHAVPHLWQVSPHLYKVRGHEYWPNFHMLVSDDGHALLIDCGSSTASTSTACSTGPATGSASSRSTRSSSPTCTAITSSTPSTCGRRGAARSGRTSGWWTCWSGHSTTTTTP